MTVVADKPRSKRKVRPAGRVASLRSGLTSWLGRPLADFHLLLAIFGMLTVLGLVMVLSASAPGQVASGVSAYSVFQKQLIYVLRRRGAVLGRAAVPVAQAPALVDGRDGRRRACCSCWC